MDRFPALAMMGDGIPKRSSAFTLVELLAGAAILALVLVILLQLTGSVLSSTRYSHQKMNASRTARAALDALAADLNQLVSERGLTVFVRPSSHGSVTNSELSFFTQGRGPRSVAPGRFVAVAYRLTGVVLERRISPVPWDTGDLLAVVDQSAGAGVTSGVADGILRFVVMAVLADGRIVPLAEPGAPWLSPTAGGLVLPGGFESVRLFCRHDMSSGSFQPVRALIIAVASLDSRALTLLGDREQALAQALIDPPQGQTAVEIWSEIVRSGGLDFPQPVVAALHFSQQTYELK